VPRRSFSIIYAVFGFGGAAFLASCMALEAPVEYKAAVAVFFVVFFTMGIFGAVGAAGIERLASVVLTSSRVSTYTMSSQTSLTWGEIDQFVVETDTGGDVDCYVVTALYASGSKLTIFDMVYYPSNHRSNADQLCSWLQKLKSSNENFRKATLAAAPGFLKSKRARSRTH
jgi:hypothetical protein